MASRQVGGEGGTSSGGSHSRENKKRQHDALTDDEEMSISQEILEALKTQNNLLRSMNAHLGSIDTRLGCIERQASSIDSSSQRQWRQYLSAEDPVVAGSWKFVESQGENREQKNAQSSLSAKDLIKMRMRKKAERSMQTGSFGVPDSEGLVLKGLEFPERTIHPNVDWNLNSTSVFFFFLPPTWSDTHGYVRNHLPQIMFNDKAELCEKSGIYSMTIKYNKQNPTPGSNLDAAIIIGETEFHNLGFAVAEGADWDRLLLYSLIPTMPEASLPGFTVKSLSQGRMEMNSISGSIQTKTRLSFSEGRLHQRPFGTSFHSQTIESIQSTFVCMPTVARANHFLRLC